MSNTNRPLWAPWRIEYIRAEKENECFLCRMLEEDTDRDNLILFRSKTCAVVMNRFPYTSGHLMVCPQRHIADFSELTQEEDLEMCELTRRAIAALRNAMQPEGFNIGTNLGSAAGAGLKDHLHRHIVPRWVGDTNFMAVIGDRHVVPESLTTTYDILLEKF
ncbi:HIT family protein [Tichowtungia aerotolerans]|uniref:HIT domain-containing protein n=1 Tax=Tichowtungia aerotolerans TaxID=2697043 RepID=A0A6P1MBC5_9BACT|nr:HIT domain-containing protein [Tichowtungia aerotolerans]QHI70403.1 HIT domain-containing protein [Tichowtungia aerotolerans]